MCRHDVVNIQHAHCGLVGPDCKTQSRASAACNGYNYAGIATLTMCQAHGCVWALPQPGGDVEQPQLMCNYDVIHKTGKT